MKKAIYSFLFFMVCFCAIAQEFTVKGSAEIINSTTYQLTRNLMSQAGLITSLYPLDLTKNFDLDFELYFGANFGNGADGIALLFSNNCNPPLNTGLGLGVLGTPESLIVEFDTFNNGSAFFDIPEDHITIFQNGGLNQANILASAARLPLNQLPPNMGDDKWHKVRIEWRLFPTQNLQALTVYFDDIFITDSAEDHITDSFGGQTNVFYSFGGSTGFFTNEHRVRVKNNSTIYNVCSGGQTTLEAPALGSNYSWTPQGGSATSTVTNSYTFPPTSPGNVRCDYIDNCVKNQTVNFTVNVFPAIVPPTIPAVSTCIGVNSSFTITGTPELVVEYNIDNGTTQTVTIGPLGGVSILVINPQANQKLTITKVSNTNCSNTVNISGTMTVGSTSLATSPIQTN